jgi:hypothetical protein
MLQMRNLHVGLWLHTERDPSAEEWTAGCHAFQELRDHCGADIASLRALVISDGGAPNAIQRAQFFRPALGGLQRTSAISNALSDPVKRGIVTAITWVNPRFRAFAAQQWWDALAHVGLTQHAAQVWNEFAKLQRGLPPNQTLREIGREVLTADGGRALSAHLI